MPAYGALNSSFTVNGAVHDPLTGLDTGCGNDRFNQYVTGDGSDQLQLDTGSGNDRFMGLDTGSGNDRLIGIDTGSGNDHIVHHLGTTSGPGGTSFFTENVNGTIGYEMEAGTDLRSDNRFVFEPMDVMPSLGESIDPGLDAAGGFQPHDVTGVQIGEPPEPKLWLQMLG